MNFLIWLLFVNWYVIAEDNKIYGGRRAKPGEFPSAVCIYNQHNRCGAALITLDKIVSTGQCFERHEAGTITVIDFSNTMVIAGTTDLDEDSEGYQSRKIVKYYLHENFTKRKSGSMAHDIATADLLTAFEGSSTLKPMQIVSSDPTEFFTSWKDIVDKQNKCTSIGWGRNKHSKLAKILKVTKVKFYPVEQCKNISLGDIDMTDFGEVCGHPVKKGDGFCAGDYGSPFFCGEYAYGIATYSFGCGADQPYYYLLFWKYIEYFGLNTGTSNFPSIILVVFPSAYHFYKFKLSKL